jgi:UDP-N-acetylmuramoylalanine--D-glutamate ligase
MNAPAPDLSGRRVAVFGLGRSGLAAVRLALAQGANVLGTDARSKEHVSEEVLGLQGQGVRLELGGHPDAAFVDVDLVVVSPGVAPLPLWDELTKRGVPVISELEFGLRHLRAPSLFVGGTNGKSTTTTLAGEMLRAGGRRVFLGGNLGVPVCEAVGQNWDALVIEVSSFQLERSPSVKPKASILLNITEDHLDRYATFADYAAAKGNAFVNQTSEDVAVVPFGDALCGEQARRGGGRLLTFGSDPSADYHVDQGAAVERSTGLRVALEGIQLHGVHNHHNLLAAFAAARALGATLGMIDQGARAFQPLSHRMQRVRVLKGVAYYDDSKATNVGAAVTAILGLTEPKGVVIAGGRDKQGSYAPLVEALSKKGRALVLIGEASDVIARAVAGALPIRRAASMKEAVAVASELALFGDAVLLSPACSSFDMFTNYAQRGEAFADAVLALPGEEASC